MAKAGANEKKIIAINNIDRVIVWSTDKRYCSLGSREAWGYHTSKIYPKKLKKEL